MARYRKKPVEVNAIQWLGKDDTELLQFVSGRSSAVYVIRDGVKQITELSIFTLEGTLKATLGDYIIEGVNGEIYPCKPDIFEKTYEAVY